MTKRGLSSILTPWACRRQLPSHGESMAQLMFRAANEANPAVPAALAEIINKALVKDADQRYQTGAEMARDLRAACAPGAGGVDVML